MVRGHLVLRLRRGAATLRTNGSFPYDFPCPLTLSVASAESKGRKAMHSFNVDALIGCAPRTNKSGAQVHPTTSHSSLTFIIVHLSPTLRRAASVRSSAV